jgi:hypothetical protein
MKPTLLLLFLSAVAPLGAQESPVAAPLTTADLVPLPGDDLDPTLPAATPAVPPSKPVDPDLPQPFDPNTLTAVVENSPFTRIVSISDSLVLTGMAYVDGKPVVTIFGSGEPDWFAPWNNRQRFNNNPPQGRGRNPALQARQNEKNKPHIGQPSSRTQKLFHNRRAGTRRFDRVRPDRKPSVRVMPNWEVGSCALVFFFF